MILSAEKGEIAMKLNVIIAVCAIGVGVVAALSAEEAAAARQFVCAEEMDAAVIWAQIKVQKRFRDPPSTKWDMFSGRGKMESAAPCVWKVYAEGRTRNGFGGMNRVNFIATVTFGRDNRPDQVTDIKIAEG